LYVEPTFDQANGRLIRKSHQSISSRFGRFPTLDLPVKATGELLLEKEREMSSIEIPLTRDEPTVPLSLAAQALGLSHDQLRYKLIREPSFLKLTHQGKRAQVSTADLRKALKLSAKATKVQAKAPVIRRREASADKAPAAPQKASKAPAKATSKASAAKAQKAPAKASAKAQKAPSAAARRNPRVITRKAR
jgi:hypothetical protein